jgi:hypothetical protein
MRETTLPGIGFQLFMAVITCLLTIVFLFLLNRHQYLPPFIVGAVTLNVPIVLSSLVLMILASSMVLYLRIWRLPEYKTIMRIEPERQRSISRLLRADAYSFLFLPLLVILTIAWEQVGDNLLLFLILLAAMAAIKYCFFRELRLLTHKKGAPPLL